MREEPGRVWPYLQRALARGELKDFDAAEADFAAAERLLQDAPDQTAQYALLVNRGVNRIHKGDPEGAVADLTLAVGQKPDESPAYLDLAKAYQDQHRLREAGEQLDRALVHTAPSGLAAVYRNRARLDQQQNDLNAAVRDLEQALRREPDGNQSPTAAADYLLMARLLMQGGKHEEAVRAADASLAIAPDEPAAHRLRAEALLRLDRFAEAVQALDRHVEAVRRGGRSPEAAVYRAAPRRTPPSRITLRRPRTTRGIWNWSRATPPATTAGVGAMSPWNRRRWPCAILRRRFVSIRTTGTPIMAAATPWRGSAGRRRRFATPSTRSGSTRTNPVPCITPPASSPAPRGRRRWGRRGRARARLALSAPG